MPIAVAIDFGTYTSGITYGPKTDDITTQFYHLLENNGYAKTRTAFLVKKDILEQIPRNGTIADKNIFPCFRAQDHQEQTNILLGDYALDYFSALNPEDLDNWVFFDRFKMLLYNKQDTVTGKSTTDQQYDLQKIITLFLQCLKLLYLRSGGTQVQLIKQQIGDDFTEWGVTIPSIWGEKEKMTMVNAARAALGRTPTIIREPEGAATHFIALINNNNLLNAVRIGKTEKYLIIDCGGGTTDIIVLEARNEGGNLKLHELTESTGNASGGGITDDNFLKLLAEKLFNYLPENEKQGRMPYHYMMESFFNSIPMGRNDLIKQWLSIKHNFTINRKRISYPLPQTYSSWLQNNRVTVYNAIMNANAFAMMNVVFTSQELEEQVFRPVIENIATKAYEAASGIGIRNIDKVFLAGGLSALSSLRNKIQNFFGEDKVCFESDPGADNITFGGSILRGAVCLLTFENFLTRVAKRYYYYTLLIPEEETRQAPTMEWNGVDPQLVEDAYQRDAPNRQILHYNGRQYVEMYLPICFKGKTAKDFYKDGLSRIEQKQTQVTLNFYSSQDMIFYFRENDPRVKHEGNVTMQCNVNVEPDDENFSIRINFNNFHQATFEAEVTNERTGKTTCMPLNIQYQRGH